MESMKNESIEIKEELTKHLELLSEMNKRVFGPDSNNRDFIEIANYFESINQNSVVSNEDLNDFRNMCFKADLRVKKTYSGLNGEKIALNYLDLVEEDVIILKNVELNNGKRKTEFDAIVITSKGVIIVEVKNSKNNVLINKNGCLKREAVNGNYEDVYDLGAKMAVKNYLLKKVLTDGYYSNVSIKSVVVFANSKITVTNESARINTCSVSELPWLIDKWSKVGFYEYSTKEMQEIADIIKKASSVNTTYNTKKLEILKEKFEFIASTLENKPENWFSKIISFVKNIIKPNKSNNLKSTN